MTTESTRTADGGNGSSPRWIDRTLNAVERIGNRLPDPAALFLILLVVVWILSALLSNVQFAEIDPRSGKPFQIQDAVKARLGDEANAAHGAAFLANAETVAPQLTAAAAPLMQSIVPLIFLLFLLPGVV
ncbi:MAG TPA: AbgT family transporter [Pyrinomonadaceae bacterium]|nr:AbgT family transporter [Pyrinomonadaceae bacterium]